MSGDAISAFGNDPVLRWQRRAMLIASNRFGGIDRVEIAEAHADAMRLRVHFVPSAHADKPAVPPHIRPDNVVVTGLSGAGPAFHAAAVQHPGRGGRTLGVDLPVGLAALGGADAGWARLEIRDVADIDPLFARAPFALAEGGPTAIDPAAPAPPADVRPAPPGIDYIAKDYLSFQRLMLDHMTTLVPAWRERHPADIGNVVVELLAYAADHLSYYQDAVATEAYLGTARRRVSVRRHARLLDYRLDEGRAARVWLHVEVDAPCVVRRGLRAVCDESGRLADGSFSAGGQPLPPRDGRAVFETLEDARLRPEHNRLPLYGWGLDGFRLHRGAVTAALDGAFPDLAKGDVLIIAGGPDAASATGDAARRHPVRLTRPPRVSRDPTNKDHRITEISWSAAEPLPFDILVDSPVTDAWGNIVAADAGFTVGSTLAEAEPLALRADPRGVVSATLRHPDLIHAVPYDPEVARSRPAAAFTRIDGAEATPAIRLYGDSGQLADDIWLPRRDLLDCDRFACAFVVECEDDGSASLRFGDDVHGLRPPPGTRLRAVYRTGRGDRNVTAGAISSWDPRPGDTAIRAVSNPLPASGGTGPARPAEVRRDAPMAFHTRRHCVIPQDYAAAAMDDPRVGQAVAVTQWTGDRRTVLVHVQPAGGGDLDPALRTELAAELEARRILGSDVFVAAPVHVPLRIALTIRVGPGRTANAARGEVVTGILNRFAGDRLRFGEPVFLSPVIATAKDVAGVVDVKVDAFVRYGRDAPSAIAAGRIDLGPTEIARLENRPDAPYRGVLTVNSIPIDARRPA